MPACVEMDKSSIVEVILFFELCTKRMGTKLFFNFITLTMLKHKVNVKINISSKHNSYFSLQLSSQLFPVVLLYNLLNNLQVQLLNTLLVD